MNPCPEWIRRFLWCTVIRVILNHKYWYRSSQRNARLIRNLSSVSSIFEAQEFKNRHFFCSVKLSTSALAVRNSTAPKDDDDQTKDSWSVWPSVHRVTMKTQPNQTSMNSPLSNAINSMRMLCHSKSRRIFCPVYDVTSQRWITGREKSQIPPEALFSSTSKKGKERERLASKLKKRVLSYFSSEEKLKTEERTNRPVFVLRSTCGL